MPDKLAQYELLTPLGAGGMGEVYRAKDTRLDREVAVKILPEALAKDPERIARFDREAKTLASLTHPNIATVHDFMTVDGTSFLVMELVEGEDLSERLGKGAIDPEDARQLAIQIAAGLEAAHERGIVHRDLKPANVRITPDGQVKILDFGLARAVTGDPEDASDPMLSPTITQAMTQAGTILGTAAYMSPEQARGKHVDKRADIWAFGVLLYEMLTGERLFEGETTSDTLASVLKNPVDFDQLDDSVSHDVLWVLQRCLDRNPTRRLRDIGEARLVLSGESTVSQMGIPAAAEPMAGKRSVLWPAISLLLAAALAALFFLRPAPEPSQLRLSLPLPEEVSVVLGARQPGPAAIAPDASAVVFSGQGPDGDIYLWYRRLDSPTAQRLDATIGASYPFWSPDSRSVGFFRENSMWRIDVPGGSPLRLADASFGKGGTWNEEGVIVFAPSYASRIQRVSARGGGLPRAVTEFDSAAGDNSHRHPFFLPDGHHFLYLARGAQDSSGSVGNSVRVGSLDGGTGRYVVGADGHAEYHDGRLVFARDGALVAQRFELGDFSVQGDPRVILPEVEFLGGAARTAASFSRTGMLIYFEPYLDVASDRVTILDRTGVVQRSIGEPDEITKVVVSPDRKRAAVVHGGNSDPEASIWIMDMERGTRARFAGGGGASVSPVWSPDGKWLAYGHVTGEANERAYLRRVDGGGTPIQLHEARDPVFPESWSPSGRRLTYTVQFAGIWMMELDEDRTPIGEPQLLVEPTDVGAAWSSCFLGNDDWIVYHSSVSGNFELYVTHVTDMTRRFQLTSSGAIFPSWDPVNRQVLFSEIGSDILYSVAVDFPVEGGDPIFATPVQLFRLPARELDNQIDVYGDEVILATGPRSDRASIPMLVTDWRRLLAD